MTPPHPFRDGAPVTRGRDHELAVITESIAAASDGVGGVLLIEGRAGVGKTHIVGQAAVIAADLGVRMGRGASLPPDQTTHMGALLEALFTGPLLDREAYRDLEARPERHYWLLEELEVLLERAALVAPLVISLDDMHWADAGTRAAIRMLPSALIGLPILWLMAFRGERVSPELRDTWADLGRLGAVRLPLEPLGQSAVTEVINDVVGAHPDPALLELVLEARGNPFLLTELLRGLLEDGNLRVTAGRAELIDARLPTRVRDEMRERLSSMTPEARHAAQVASILGGSFSVGWLVAMLGLTPTALLAPLEELLHADLLAELEDGRLAFRHDLLREAVLGTLSGSMRRALQRQAADVLMQKGAPPQEVAGLLAVSAERGDDAAVEAMLKAVQQLGPADPGVAADLGRRALELAAVDNAHRGPLVAETAVLLYAADRTGEGETFATDALASGLPAHQQAEIRLGIAQMYAVDADVRIAHGRTALDLPDIPTEVRSRHLAWLSHNLLGAGRVDEARAVILDAEAEVVLGDDERAVFRMAVVMATLDFVDGRYASALDRLDRALEMPAGNTNRTADLASEVVRCEALAAMDQLDAALEIAEDRLAAAQRDRLSYAVRVWEQYRGRRLLELGRLPDAAAALEGAIEPGVNSVTVDGSAAPAVVAMSRVAVHLGATGLIHATRQIAQDLLETGTPEVRRHAAWLLMLQAAAESDPAAIHDALVKLGDDSVGSVLPQIRYDPTDEVQLVRVALAISDSQLVERAVSAAERRHCLNPDVRSLAGTAAQARALRSGDIAELTEAVELFADAPRPLALASAVEDLGRAHVKLGQRDQAVASFGRALELYTSADAGWDAGRLRRRLRDLGVRRRLAPPSRPTHGWAGLTDSEIAIAQLVSEGLTNREVALRVFLSPHTVGMHLRHAFAKLDINSRVELTRIVMAHSNQG